MKISAMRLLRTLLVLVIAIIVIIFLNSIRTIFIPFVLGFIIAYILEPFVGMFEKRMPRDAAIFLIYAFVGVTLFVTFYYVFPVLFRELNRLLKAIPEYTHEFQNMLWSVQIGYDRVPIPEGVRQVTDRTIGQMEMILIGVIEGLVNSLMNLFSQTFNFVLAPVLGYYFLKEYPHLGKLILEFIPLRYRHEIKEIGGEINTVLKEFIRGNLVVAFFVAVLAALGMYIIGMDFPIFIGIVVGITNFIPYFGAIISTIPVVFLALLKSRWLAVYVLGLMIFIQQIEGNIIAPKIIGDCVGLHPLVIIFALLAGGHVWGIGGMLLAVPLAAVLKILIRHIYLHII